MKYLVTGGAGFIGSHIVDELIKRGDSVVVYDNLSTGKREFISQHESNDNFRLVVADILDTEKLISELDGIDFVFHLAAHADVRSGYEDHDIDHAQNLEGTQSVLEAMYKAGVKKIAFASTSSVYGDASVHPTPESYPFEPTSLYGATKAACESYIYAYAKYYDWDVYIFRFVSWIGERYTHGIIFDLLKKLSIDSKSIELMSDGTPRKSSLYVKDGVNAIFTIITNAKEKVNIYNLGHDEVLTVDEIVETIFASSQLRPEKEYIGGNKGWRGDNNFVHLDTTKLKKLGWTTKTTIKQGIDKTVRYLLDNPQLLSK